MAITTRTLGRTGADVTILGYGAMELRGQPRGPQIADEDAGRLLNAVLDGGINLIDTSPDYGRSEELIGAHIGHRRDEFFLASKCGCLIEIPADAAPPYPHDYSAANVRADVEQSLRRLRTDRLDLVQVHMSPSRATLEENGTVEMLRALQREGKVRFIGMSGILPNLPDHIAMNVFDVFQIPYSAVQRDHEELITEAADADDPAGIVAALMGAVPPGSFLVISHLSADHYSEADKAADVYQDASSRLYLRQRAAVGSLFGGLPLEDPGDVVWTSQWHPDADTPPVDSPGGASLWCGIARKSLLGRRFLASA